ncbi:hypothetical protein HNY73_018288 [Argiope bruennichi]|uniref:Uncharacterized protein n=1 Tax=Argiope bruennichi TaxID=94029 RepID=A0A8T0EDF0_ARGBR|nr:hypothetical protein HNY73_018288 [Argiope bruennichi]
MKLENLPKTATAGNIFKPIERQDILRLAPQRSSSKSSTSSTSSLRYVPKKKKPSPLPDRKGFTKHDSDASDSSDEDVLSSSIGKLKELANLPPEDSFLRRHELYVTDIEDSTDVIFAISPTIRKEIEVPCSMLEHIAFLFHGKSASITRVSVVNLKPMLVFNVCASVILVHDMLGDEDICS